MYSEGSGGYSDIHDNHADSVTGQGCDDVQYGPNEMREELSYRDAFPAIKNILHCIFPSIREESIYFLHRQIKRYIFS